MTTTKMNDLDPQETLEWIEAMEAVIERDGFERAQFLLRRLADRAVTVSYTHLTLPTT